MTCEFPTRGRARIRAYRGLLWIVFFLLVTASTRQPVLLGDSTTDGHDPSNSPHRVIIYWGHTNFASADNFYCPGPAWWLGGFKLGGDWTPAGWHVASSESNAVGALLLNVDRAILTRNLVFDLRLLDTAGSSLYLDLLDAKGRPVLTDLFGNLMEGSDRKQQISFEIPFESYPDAATIVLRRGSGEITVSKSVLHFDGELGTIAAGTERGNRPLDGDGNEAADFPVATVAGLPLASAPASAVNLLLPEKESPATAALQPPLLIRFQASFEDSLVAQNGSLPVISQAVVFVQAKTGDGVDLRSAPSKLAYRIVDGTITNLDVVQGSASIWIRPNWTSGVVTNVPTFWQIVATNATGVTTFSMTLSADPARTNLSFQTSSIVGVTTQTVPIKATINWQFNEWHEVAFTWDRSTGQQLFVDGKLVANTNLTAIPTTLPNQPDRFFLGTAASGSLRANSTFDELIIYNLPLSSAQAQQFFTESQLSGFDVDGDGVFNQADLDRINAFANRTRYPANNSQFRACDLDGDGVITAQDVAILQMILNGKPVALIRSPQNGSAIIQ